LLFISEEKYGSILFAAELALYANSKAPMFYFNLMVSQDSFIGCSLATHVPVYLEFSDGSFFSMQQKSNYSILLK
jgi:hypothetical protein